MKRYYAAADLHVVTSYIETFSYAAVEAALAGTCTVMTDRIGAGHWLEEVGASVVVRGRASEDFAAGIESVLAQLPDAGRARGMAERTAEALSLDRVTLALEGLLMRYVPAADHETAAA